MKRCFFILFILLSQGVLAQVSEIWRNSFLYSPASVYNASSPRIIEFNDNTFVTGEFLTNYPATESRVWGIRKYSTSGFHEWDYYTDTFQFSSTIRNVLVDNQGNTILLGDYKDAEFGDTHLFAVMINQDGQEVWTYEVADSIGTGHFVIQDNQNTDEYFIYGHLITATLPTIITSYLVKINSSGQVLWNKEYSPLLIVNKVMQDSSGDLLMAGIVGDSVYLHKLSSTGQFHWTKTANDLNLDDSKDWTGAVMDNNDNIYIAGWDGFRNNSFDNTFSFLLKFNNDGDQQWVYKYETGIENRSQILRLNTDQTSAQLLVGYFDTPSFPWKLRLLTIDQDGNLLDDIIENDALRWQGLVSMELDQQDDIYIRYRPTFGTEKLVKIDKDTRNQIWEYDLSDDYGWINIPHPWMQINADNDIYLTGNPRNPPPGILTIKLDQVVGIGQIYQQDENITIKPNPFHEQTTIEINEPGFGVSDIQVFNSLGQFMEVDYQTKDQSIQINRGNLPSGLYFIYIFSAEGRQKRVKVVAH